MTHYIYTLEHPITKDIRYIGQSINPINRLSNHLATSTKNRNTRTHKWILSLINQGLKPVMHILDTSDTNNIDQLEMYWISQLKSWNFNLTNHELGGKSCIMVSAETKLTLSNSLKQFYKSDKGIESLKNRKLESSRRGGVKRNTCNKKVINNSNGQIFNCIRDAAKELGISYQYLGQCLLGNKKNLTNFAFI